MYTIANVRPFGHNVGNHAIHVALRQMIYESFGRIVSIIEFPATVGSGESGSSGLTRQSVHQINRFADGVIVGGGNLFENDAVDIDAQALAALQPPLLLFSNSWGRIYDRFGNLSKRSDSISTDKMSMLLSRADISLSRDSTTHGFARSLNQKDQLGWCPTISYSRYQGILPLLPAGEEAGALISIRTPELMNIPYKLQSRVPAIIEKVIDHLREAGHDRIRLLCNDSRDLDFATLFRFSKSVDSVYASDVYEYLALLSQASFLVSFRLHATLPAISFGTPVINICYDERAECLIRDLGVEESSLNLVRLGDSFLEAISAVIDEGGYGPLNHQSQVANWDSKVEFQLDSLRRFKSLVRSYISQGSTDA